MHHAITEVLVVSRNGTLGYYVIHYNQKVITACKNSIKFSIF